MGPRQKPEIDNLPEPSMAPYEVQRAQRQSQSLLTIFQTLFLATKGVFRPGPDDPKTWYGRLLRLIGLLCVYAVIAIIIAVAIQNLVRGRP